jgi:HK97 gp10 family phage protein
MENKLDGLAETLDALKAMGVEVKSKKLQNLLKKSSAPIIATAKSLVPVDTGDLRDSIGFINSKDNANFDKALIGLRKEYYNNYLGVMYEYGTVNRIQASTGRYTGVIAPVRFMQRAVDSNATSVEESIIKGVDQIIADLAKKNNLIYK